MVWRCHLCGRLLVHPDDDTEHEDWHETVLCPICGDSLLAWFPLGDESKGPDFLSCVKCEKAFHPDTLKVIAQVV